MSSQLVTAYQAVAALGSTLSRGDGALNNVPGMLKEVIREGYWREFRTPLGQVVRYERFEDFLATPPADGLGASEDLLRRMVKKDREAEDLLDQALQRPHGGTHSKNDNVNLAVPDGNSSAQALRHLRKNRPDLHAEVLAGTLSPHRAMVIAGDRPATATVRLDDPKRAARTLKAKTSPQFCAELAALLADGGG